MAKFRKLPVEIEAFRMGIDNRPDWFCDKVSKNEITTHYCDDEDDPSNPFDPNKTYCKIKTLAGVMTGDFGDYIIKGMQGEVYPRKPGIFHETYERC